ncbi:SRPBCC domain-containing protein [Paeniglutamicibacter cryotolerans]|uniref:Uncharacterized protein YndB with AHSA1/START domain n=1 Tax=Paeniglutamicibacter cryotolerans TaxID=670079 RepID=A0A839QP65_9MICC|nr:SRPBCC domain-containing protein [Paeniglutamicibacter cryotolerans]MBB2995786.1 uncharacterized protein YndB with AHSA1/START domain [Paeniglutamicibacter cryotolerans]
MNGSLDTGTVLEADPPRKLVMTMTTRWDEEATAEGETRIAYGIVQVGNSCQLTVIHDLLRDGVNGQLYGGWLETGERPGAPGSLRYT